MNTKPRLNIRLIALCSILCLSIASYLTLHVMETHSRSNAEYEIMAEDMESNEALPDVQLIKRLMHKTLEFMLVVPRIQN
jgi:hypothetical protein